MTLAFGRFVLDERARTLRLDGEERALQPLVFDLLVYLVRHRERVVSKDELLDELWGGAAVTDGSLQRAISLLRGVLRDGGMEQAIQTFARRGYRFCDDAASGEWGVEPLQATQLSLAGHWTLALEAFETAADRARLSATDWEAWGNAALCSGEPLRAVEPLEQAYAAFERASDRVGAARIALLLSNLKLEARELAVAKGWLQRAHALLKDETECKEHGLAEWLASRLALFEGRLDECRSHARVALAVAERIGDPDLHCLSLIYQGHISIAQSEVRAGLALHDEAGAAALGGRVSPWVSGIVFCSVIWAYLHLGDHHRAGQWTDQFARWCQRNASYCYPALCRLHRGEILAMRGELLSAEAEVSRAREQLAIAGPFVEGDACRVLGEIRLAQGDLAGAERAFRESHRLGWNPQPGLSLLLAARGDADGALKQLERALAEPTWTDGQRRGSMLAVLVRVAAVNGQRERARTALAELDTTPELRESHASAAEFARAQGELAWAERDLPAAERALRASVGHWLEVAAPLHAAEVRLRLCELLLDAEEPTAAELELGAAEATYLRVAAEPLLERCRGLRARFCS